MASTDTTTVPQFSTKLGAAYHHRLRRLALHGEVTIVGFIRAVIELCDEDPDLTERVALRAHHLSGLPGQR